MKVAILGVGTVGSEVANILIKNKDIILARAGVSIEPVIGLVRDTSKKRGVQIPLSSDAGSIIERDDIDVFVELMGGVEKPYKIVSEILKRKKAVVTANKALLAYHRYKLQALAGDTPFGFEASVAGGIPIIKTLREGLSANRIEKIIGIVNGTSNFILTNMMQKNEKFEDALKRAQELGYAETDPSFDIGGVDAAHKLLILASIAYGVHGDPEDILIEGIEEITQEDIYFAREFDFIIKLLAVAKRACNNKVELRVHPGAGGSATASAVISDLIDIARDNKNPMLGYKILPSENFMQILPSEQICTKYYFRLRVRDEKGVLAKLTNIMSLNDLSIDSFLQKPKLKTDEEVTLFFTTHTCCEKDIKHAISVIGGENFITQKPFMIRIES